MHTPVAFGPNGAFAFYSHNAEKAVKKGFLPASIILSNHYIHADEEMYTFEVPDVYLQSVREESGWTEEMKFLRARNSEAHIMLLKAAIFGDMDVYLAILDNPDDAALVKEMGKGVRGFSEEKWFQFLPSVALEVVWQKFTKVPAFHAYLVEVASQHKLIIEHTKNDGLWGNGADLEPGQKHTVPALWRDPRSNEQACNILGWALMQVGKVLIDQVSSGHVS